MNKQQQLERNRAMCADRAMGMSIKDLSTKYGVSKVHVANITAGHALTDKKRIRERVESCGLDGIRVWAVGQNISYPTLYRCLKEMGHKTPRKETIKRVPAKVSKVYATIAALQGGATCSDKDAARLGVTRQYIELVRRYCEAAGVKL